MIFLARGERAGPLMVLGSIVTVQTGTVLGKGMFGAVGPAGVVVLRLCFAAVLLLAVWRPKPPERRSYGLIAALGVAIAGMHLLYPAMERLPVGISATVQYLGPLTLALAASRRLMDVGWALLAGLGVFLVQGGGAGGVSWLGIALALGSGVAMAAYLVLNKRGGDGSVLAWAVVFAALLVLPLGPIAAGGELLRPEILLAGAGVALVSAVIPWSLDMAALRRLPERVVAVMVSLEPGVGALAGLILLGEHLAWTQWTAVACVSIAAAGAVTTAHQSSYP
ncbi:EamA family transporter [Spirillospora sp. NPDC050679]